VDQANALLDEMGQAWVANHKLAPARRISMIISSISMKRDPNGPVTQLVKEYWPPLASD
jgi:hypothetical protein